MKRSFIFASILFFTSCGYHFGRGELSECYQSICIPYAEGDEQGYLTTALIKTMSVTGVLTYRNTSADLILRVCLLKPTDTNIGFEYAPHEKYIVSDEARYTVTAVVRLIDRCTGDCVIGPCEISASWTYDFQPDASDVNEHAFALGQLEMHDLALDAATPAIYNLLAKKIVDYVNHCW